MKSFKIKVLEEKWKLEPLRTKGLREQTALSSLTLQGSLIALTQACLQAEGTYTFDHLVFPFWLYQRRSFECKNRYRFLALSYAPLVWILVLLTSQPIEQCPFDPGLQRPWKNSSAGSGSCSQPWDLLQEVGWRAAAQERRSVAVSV